MARRRKRPISKTVEGLKKATSENEAVNVIKLTQESDTEAVTQDANSDLKRDTTSSHASVPTPESGVSASEGDEDLSRDEDVELKDLKTRRRSTQTSLVDEQEGASKTTNMARAYGKYTEELKDTPKHLYGFDGALMSSDEDAEINVHEISDTSSKTNSFHKLTHFVKDHWKEAIGGISLFIISGILFAFLVQIYTTPTQPLNDPHSDALKKIEEKVDQLSSVLQKIQIIATSSELNSSSDNKTVISEESVQQIVQAALERYNADKVGMADFALESSGAEIHDSYHSESYDVGSARVVFFGIPLWFDIKPPSVILQPDNSPGNCWAFKGDKGYVVMKLSKTLIPTAFSMEHIPKLLSPTGDGRIPSAPKEFTVWGWKDPLGGEREKLGYYIYDNEGDFLQTFDVQLTDGTEPVQYIELRILSNHGNPEYTCLYRFRVHGNPR